MKPRTQRWAVTTLAAVGLVVGGGVGGAAQSGTPTGGGSVHAHPAHIHLGSCDALDPNPTFMLADVAALSGDPATTEDVAAAIPVERSATTVDAALADLHSGGYAINIHQSAEEIGTYIACGNLGGSIDAAGADEGERLVVGLGELNDSGHSGIAVLDGRGDQTDVTVYLAEGLSGGAAARAAGASGAAADGAAADEAETAAASVEIVDFTYAPDPIEIPVGGTVTWTNSDAVPHTATARDRDVLQSGTLDQGESYSQTFAEPGSFDYFCEFHGNMKGTVVVG